MKKSKRILALLTAIAMCIGMLSVSAIAVEGEPEGGGGGGEGGGSSASTSLEGMLSLSQYVFVDSEGEISEDGTVSATVYGVYTEDTDETDGDSQYVPTDYSGTVSVYTDDDATEAADAVATIADGTITITGVATEGNVAYYLVADDVEGAYVTTIYVVNDEYDEETATLTLADGTTVDLTTYAPNMAYGDYSAVVGENEINGETSVYIGANRTAVTVDDLTDIDSYTESELAVVQWWLSAGVTNSGNSITTFGDELYNFEYVVTMYRLFQLVNEQMTFTDDFVDASDYVSGMGSNDQFSDAVSATMGSGIWNGIYTKYSDELLPTEEGTTATGYLYENISEDVTELGVFETATVEFIYVALYNAFQSAWSSLSEEGEALAVQLEELAAEYEGETLSAPDDYSNESKIAAVATALYEYPDDDGTGDWSWASEYIYLATAAGIFEGFDTGEFEDESNLTRAQAAKIIVETLGIDIVEADTSTFTDVDDSHWALEYIETLAAEGVVEGYGDGTFEPDDTITRAEFAKMIVVALGIDYEDAADSGLTDIEGHWAEDYINACYAAGIIEGYEDETYRPDNNIERSESSAVMIRSITSVGDVGLSKIEALSVLYEIRDCVESVSYADEETAEAVGSSYANIEQYMNVLDVSTLTSEAAGLYVSEDYCSNMINESVDLVNYTFQAADNTGSYISYGWDVVEYTAVGTGLDGGEAATGLWGGMGDAFPEGYGFVYNATFRNAFYREGVGSGVAIVGAGTQVTMTTDDGTLVLSGNGGSMAGTAYVAFGASLTIQNAVAFSSSQHLTNNLYNGTIHYLDSYAIGGGRVYSSDFWGGYQVYEDSIATGGNVTDEPTTLIVKNSVYGTSVGGNGYASQYFENSILNVSGASFQNTTSLITDTGSLTLVNSVMNNSGSYLVSATKGENVIVTLVDSTINMEGGNTLASLDASTTINHNASLLSEEEGGLGDEVYNALFDSEIAIYVYGENTIVTSDGTLNVTIAEGATLYIYSSNLTEADITVDGEGTLVVVTDEAYGTLTVEAAPEEEEEEVVLDTGGMAGMLALETYVVSGDDAEGADSVEITYYGVYQEGEDDDLASYVVSDVDVGTITVYTDVDLTEESDSITATIVDDTLVIEGLSGTENTVLYLLTYDGACTTYVYIVADETEGVEYETQNDNLIITLSEYAPDNTTSDVYIGGNQNLFSTDDYEDLDDADETALAAAAWWLSAGITNAGTTIDEFGDTLYLMEYMVYLYRNYQVMVDEDLYADGFVQVSNYAGGQGANDQFSDSIDATFYAGIWDGIYTTWTEDGLLENVAESLDEDGALEMPFGEAVTEEQLLVTIYNALTSTRTSLTDEGVALGEAFAAAAGEDPDTANKMAAVEEVLGIDYSELLDTYSQKIACLIVMSALDGCTQGIQSLEDTCELSGSRVEYSMSELLTLQSNTIVDTDTAFISSDELASMDYDTALYAIGGTITITDSLILAGNSNSIAAETVGSMDMTTLSFSSHYNLTVGNAYYRYGLGGMLVAHGYSTVVNISSTTGELVVDGTNCTSAGGGLYTGFGSTINVTNGVVYSAGNHPSNTCYNGTLHYYQSAVMSCGRQYSSDFWGGYIVLEDSIGIGMGFGDEPTTIIYTNSYTNMTSLNSSSSGNINITGFASIYFEDSVVDNGKLNFTNNTSCATDTTSLTMVNTTWNGESIGTVVRSSNNVTTLVDSTLNLSTGVILDVSNWVTQNYMEYEDLFTSEIVELYRSDVEVYIEGEVYINSDETICFDIESYEGGYYNETDGYWYGEATVTLYVSDIVGDASDYDFSNITIVYGDDYGTLYINQ